MKFYKNMFTIIFFAFSIITTEIKRDWSNTINKNKLILFIAVSFILIATAIAYYPCLQNGFVWDDEGYILKNYHIKNISLDNLKTIITTPVMANYHPLTILSYAWEYHFFKLNPMPYHMLNLVMHLLNCILVFYFILRLRGNIPVALITGLLFGIHPLHVESVAWISERKDVLYAFFYLLSLICYLSYLDKTHERKNYLYTLFFFLLSLLSKPMAITLPLVLFLMDYFHERKISYRTIIEKIPFFLLSILSGIATLLAQRISQNSDPEFAFPVSIFVASYGYVFYLFKIVLPIKLAALYRYPQDNNLFIHIEYLVAPIIIFLLVSLIYYSSKYTKKAVWGGLFYCITLLPVIQLLPIGMAVASDRYTYIPLVGIFYILSEFFVWTWRKIPRNHSYLKIIAVIISLAVVVQLVFLSRNLCTVWKNEVSLWSNVIKHYPQTDAAYANRGTAYGRAGEHDNALRDLFTTIRINPKFAAAYNNICSIYASKKEYEKALPYCEKALKTNPKDSNTYLILGDIYQADNELLSIEMYKKSISLSPYNYTGHSKLCNAYLSLQKYNEAYPACFKAVLYNPEDVSFCNQLGNTYLNARQYDKATSFYLQALLVNPNLPVVHGNLAVLYYYLKDYKSSIKHFNIAISLGHKVDPEFRKLIEEHQKETIGLKK